MRESEDRQSRPVGDEGARCLWVADARMKGYHHPERVKCQSGMSVACVNCGGPTAPITDDIPIMGGINELKLAREGWHVVRHPRTGVALRKERIAGPDPSSSGSSPGAPVSVSDGGGSGV